MMYTQAMVAGGLIVLQVDGQVYEYHFADGREPFLCDRPGEPARKDSLD
jgi:hypothetical protein